MAEAHQAVHLLPSDSYRHVKLVYDAGDDEFLTIRINSASLRQVLRWVQRTFVGWRNEVKNTIFPHSFLNYLLAVCAPPVLMLWKRSATLPVLRGAHSALWSIAGRLPATLGRGPRVGLTSALTGSTIFVTLLLLRRGALRALLGYRGWMYDAPRTTSWATALWGMGLKLLTGRHPLLYSNQSSLPRMPVPSLKHTVEHYLESIKPVFSEEEMAVAKRLGEQFLKNEGPRLNRYLTFKSWVASNYVTDWWEKYVYLRGRAPIMINSNYYVGDHFFLQMTPHPASRAATAVHRAMEFKQMIDTQSLEPMSIRGMVPMCMEQYRRTFSTTRLPGKDCDTIVHLSPDESRHIVVLSNGVYFSMDLYHRNGDLLNVAELELQFERIIEESKTMTPTATEAHIAALTAGDRTKWYEARRQLFSHGINKYSLDMIEKAICVLIFDDSKPEDATAQGYASIHGKGYDRWFDKSINIIVYANGKTGLNCEHAWADAPVIGQMWEYVLIGEAVEGSYNAKGRCIVPPGATMHPMPAPTPLQWSLNSDAAKNVIQEAVVAAESLINELHLRVMCFDEFGKGLMKQCRVSPDGFIQQALQLAYYKQNKVTPLTYESSMTRLYLHGRTETVRSATMDSKKWVLSMFDESVAPEERMKLFQKACGAHQDRYRDAMSGLGVDRHLFALYVVSQGLGVDSEFLKHALKEPWRLSTSQQPQQQTTLWDPSGKDANMVCCGGGFGPVADDGYGVSYMVAGEDILFFHVSSKKTCPTTDSDKFADDIRWALREIRGMLEACKSAKKKQADAPAN
eukprot:comp23677_c0_seq2/m.40532 comp23677_c0_seq2/g.40532  ORF comp23677_c0_seq2/g.40532 comp23677_c0_seq2/m.40532 type:complete len:796 (-) comp23677_c0_seq2:437-2824(-)